MVKSIKVINNVFKIRFKTFNVYEFFDLIKISTNFKCDFNKNHNELIRYNFFLLH